MKKEQLIPALVGAVAVVALLKFAKTQNAPAIVKTIAAKLG